MIKYILYAIFKKQFLSELYPKYTQNMHYYTIMDTHVISEISSQLLSRIQPPRPHTHNPIYPLPNRRAVPPQDWLQRMKPRLTQQINAFLLNFTNITQNIQTNCTNNDEPNAIPSVFTQILSHLTTYKQFFTNISHDKYLTYRVTKFILATNGFISIFGDAFDSDTMDVDTDPTWIFFISLIYGILDHNIDSKKTPESPSPINPYHNTDNIPTNDLYNYLYTLFNQLPSPDMSYLNSGGPSPVYNLLQYITTLWQQIHTPQRTIAALRALKCEHRCWHLQTNHFNNKYDVPRDVVANTLIEKGISTVLLCFRPRRSTPINKWRQLYWTATLTQLIDDASDATEDINNNIASTTGIALCTGDIPTYLAATLDTISYVYYNHKIFDATYQKLSIFHQIVLYGAIKNIKANKLCGLHHDWLSTHVYPNFILDLDTLHKLKHHKLHILQLLLSHLLSTPYTP